MTGRICSDAATLYATSVPDNDVTELVAQGRWPAARLYQLHQLLERDGKLVQIDDSVPQQMNYVARWVLSVITDTVMAVTGELTTEAERLAMGFWNVDRLPCNTTIGSFWNYSPFKALQTAPPLSDADEEED